MAVKRLIPGFLLFLFITFNMVFAQTEYVIVATKGSSALFKTPRDRNIAIGQVFLAKRRAGGQEIEVAQVKVALVEQDYCGVKIEKPLAANKLRTGDFLVGETKSSFEETLSFLDGLAEVEKSASDTRNPSNQPDDNFTSSQPNASTNNSENSQTNPTEQPDDILTMEIPSEDGFETMDQPSSSESAESENIENLGPTVSPPRIKNSFLGPSIAMVTPIARTADIYAAGPRFGLQVLTELGFATNLRFSAQYTLLKPAAAVKSTLDSLGSTQKSSLSLLSISIQPTILNNFVLDLGTGYYRQHDEVQTRTRLSSVTKNAMGILTGLGYHFSIGSSSSLMLLATSNFYFLKGDNATFLSFTAGYFFTL